MEKIRTIFIGTPLFAVPALKALIGDNEFDIIAVVTQPDKKVGRKQVVTPPPVKTIAEKYKIPVWQPPKISDFGFPILDLDLIVVAAYAQIIPKNILNLPKYGCVNVHGSLLPKYRGASCVQAAILNGDEETGITVMKMDSGLDTGPILAQRNVKIDKSETAGTLYSKLADLGAKTLIPALKKYIADAITPIAQDNSKASFARELKKEDGKIDWDKPAEEIERFIRAMNPWPGAFASLKIKNQKPARNASLIEAGGSKIKIIKTESRILNVNNFEAGKIFLHNNQLAVQCGRDALIIERLQLEGKKEMGAEEFLRGHKNLIGQILN